MRNLMDGKTQMLRSEIFAHPLALILMVCFVAGAALSGANVQAQEDDQSSQPTQTEERTGDNEENADEQAAAEDDDDTFVPSEEVSSDNSISFPVDI